MVTFMVNKCIVNITCDSNGNIGPDSVCRITLQDSATGSDEEDSVSGSHVTGKVIDAVTGNGISGVDLYFRSGTARTGQADKSSRTDAYGSYTIDLPSGNYMVEIRGSGYTTEFFSIYVGTYQDTMTQNFSVSPVLQEGEIRIVLEWGSYPEDLDSHLRGTGAGHSVHIFYSERYDSAAELDVDDINGYGPETITIRDTTGSYTYDVVDYQNTGDLSASGAVVKVYVPGQDVITIRIADAVDESTATEKVWHVVKIENGSVTVDNRIVNA